MGTIPKGAPHNSKETDLGNARPLLHQTMGMEPTTALPTVKNGLSRSPFYSMIAGTLVFLLIVAGSILFGLYYHQQATHSKREYERLLENFKVYNGTLAQIGQRDNSNCSQIAKITVDLTDELLEMKDSFEKIISEKNEQIERLKLQMGMLGSHPELLKSDIDLDENDGQTEADENNKIIEDETQVQKEFARINANITDELFLAIDRNELETVLRFVALGADVNGHNNKSVVPIHSAADSNNKTAAFKIIQILIDNGADPWVKDEEDHTFLHKLVDDGTNLTPQEFHIISEYIVSKNLTKLFNAHGSFYKIFDTPRWSYLYRLSTPFHMAVKNLEIEIATLQLLQKNGVNFNSINSNDDSILFYALMGKRSVKFLSNLVQLGANWEHLNNYNSSLLHRAAVFGSSKEELKFFLDLGLEINSVNAYDNTPLHLVVSWNNGIILEMVQFLIESGADVELKDNYGRTALDIAIVRNNMINRDKIVKLLKSSQHTNNEAETTRQPNLYSS